MELNDVIASEPQPICPVCGNLGAVKYQGLTDRLFGAAGVWTLRECGAAECGTLWLDPRPTDSDVGKAYRRYYTHTDSSDAVLTFYLRVVRALARERGASCYGFSSSAFPWPGKHLANAVAALYPGLRAHLDLMIRYLPASSMGNGMLLDVGCGSGEALEILGDLGWRVCGVEVDGQAATAARARGLDVRHGTLIDADFADETFDAVTSSHVIEHVHDPRSFLAESRRILRTGGTLIAVTPNVGASGHKRYGEYWRGLEPPRHLALFTQNSLRALGELAGFRDVSVTVTARAVALSEIASAKVRDNGRYQEGQWPGFRTWIGAQARQSLTPLYMKLGLAQGSELVLRARK